MMSDQSLDGAVAVVTGASRGIGAATAVRLAREGAAVALVARRRDRLAQVVDEIAAAGGHAMPLALDITEAARAEEAIQLTMDRFGRLDILVNNAGLRLLNSALRTTVDEWDRMIALNVAALVHVTHAAVPYLIDAAATSPRQVADLVNVGSTAGRVARPGSSVYNLTRFGLNGFTESLRQELLAEHVRVSLVEPGAVDGVGPGPVDAEPAGHVEALRADDIADAIRYIVTRERWVAVNEMLVRAGDQTW